MISNNALNMRGKRNVGLITGAVLWLLKVQISGEIILRAQIRCNANTTRYFPRHGYLASLEHDHISDQEEGRWNVPIDEREDFCMALKKDFGGAKTLKAVRSMSVRVKQSLSKFPTLLACSAWV